MAEGLAGIAGVAIDQRVETNGVFVTLPQAAVTRLVAAGASFHYWPEPAEGDASVSLRLICGWDTRPEDVERFLSVLREG
ncbi:hypothetical protein [Paracoccus cavernae]|uniref:hypothetical protein n=1 Tax=Paracoccus cavernae TaxID=1571207 RepID=UPI003630333F